MEKRPPPTRNRYRWELIDMLYQWLKLSGRTSVRLTIEEIAERYDFPSQKIKKRFSGALMRRPPRTKSRVTWRRVKRSTASTPSVYLVEMRRVKKRCPT